MTLTFYIFSFLLCYSALSVILRRNPVIAVLHLVLAFVSCAVLWLLLEVEFLSMALILVYVGAVMVLFLFVIMMLEANLAQLKQVFTGKAPLGIFLVSCAFVFFIYSFTRDESLFEFARIAPIQSESYDNTYELGRAIFERFVYPFELAALVLLLAIVAAIYLNLRRRPDVRRQDPSEQIRTKKSDRLKIVQVASVAPAKTQATELPAKSQASPTDDSSQPS